MSSIGSGPVVVVVVDGMVVVAEGFINRRAGGAGPGVAGARRGGSEPAAAFFG